MREYLDFASWWRLGSCQCHSWHLVPLMPAEVPMAEREPETEELTSDELLVEEVSIDGMCGVY
jgi:mycofactocin precursor